MEASNKTEQSDGKKLKANYYPHDTFLGAKLGTSLSFVLRSVLTAHNILEQGLGCRVGWEQYEYSR